MNTNNIILDGVSAIINQFVTAAVAEAVKPLKERILALELEEEGVNWGAIQLLQDRIIALEINQSMGKSVFNLADTVDITALVSGLVADLVAGFDFIRRDDAGYLTVRTVVNEFEFVKRDEVAELVTAEMNVRNLIRRNEVIDLVDTVVTNAVDNYDFSDSFDFESAIENYDFSDIIEANMPNELDKDVVEEMIYKAIDEALNKLVIVRE